MTTTTREIRAIAARVRPFDFENEGTSEMTTTPATQVLFPVTQSDRDAAADYLDTCGWDWGACGDIRSGRVDHPVVQAFARHRQAHNLPGDALEAGRSYIKSCGYWIEADGLCAKDVDEGHADNSERMKAFRAGWAAALPSHKGAGE